jgi:hypothetical protein
MDVPAQEGQQEFQDPIRSLLVQEMASTRQDPKDDIRQPIHRRMNIRHRDPTVPVPGHDQARDVDLTEATSHGIRVPTGHQPEYGTDVGRVAHETTIDVPGRRRHL